MTQPNPTSSEEKFPPRAWIDSSDWTPEHSGTMYDGTSIAYANKQNAKDRYDPTEYISKPEVDAMLKAAEAKLWLLAARYCTIHPYDSASEIGKEFQKAFEQARKESEK